MTATTTTSKKTIRMIKLKEPIEVYCPTLRATLSLYSDEIDELGRFSQFILWVMGHGHGLTMIEETTLLAPYVIRDEVAYLEKIGLIEDLHDHGMDVLDGSGTHRLTALGAAYFRKICTIDEFNASEHQVLINGVSGELIPVMDVYPREKLSPEAVVLNEKIVRELYQNLDPANAQAFLTANYPFELNEEEREALHVSVNYRNELLYIRQLIEFVPAFTYDAALLTQQALVEEREDQEDHEEIRSSLNLEFPFLPFQLCLRHERLRDYRMTLDTLVRLEQFDSALLSEKSKELIALHRQESVVNQRQPWLYLDQTSGAVLRQLPPEPRDGKRKVNSDLCLEAQFHLDDLALEHFQIILQEVLGEALDLDEWELTWEKKSGEFVRAWVNGNDIID